MSEDRSAPPDDGIGAMADGPVAGETTEAAGVGRGGAIGPCAAGGDPIATDVVVVDGGGRDAGDVVIRADVVGTVLFAVTAVLAAWLFTSLWQWVAAITALVLFAVGVFSFLWSYYNAVQRSRHDVISVTQLYLLLGRPTPPRVRRVMLTTLAVQVLVAVATTFARLDGPDGKPGSSLALGFLVPMFGFGLNGLWAAYHATFPPRPDVVPGSTAAVPE